MKPRPSPLDLDPESYQPPATWTPEHVMHRMVEAYGFLMRTKGSTKPKGYGSGWPGYLHDQADVNSQISNMILADGSIEKDSDRDIRLRHDAEFEAARMRATPDQNEIDRMDEALGWPARYLKGRYDLAHKRQQVFITEWARDMAREDTKNKLPIGMIFDEAALIATGLRRDGVAVR